MMSTSTSVTNTGVCLDPQPPTPTKKTLLSPSNRYALSATQANKVLPVISSATASQLNSYQPESSTAFIHFVPHTTNKSISSADLRGDNRNMAPGAISSSSSNALYKKDFPVSGTMPAFNTTFNLDNSPSFNQTQPEIQDPFPFYSNTGFIMDDAFVLNTTKDGERSYSRTQQEIIAPPAPPFGTAMDMNLDFGSFVHFREDMPDVYQFQTNFKAAVAPEVSSMVVEPESSSQPRTHQREQSHRLYSNSSFDSSPVPMSEYYYRTCPQTSRRP